MNICAACWYNDIARIQELISSGVDVNKLDINLNCTPLFMAAECGYDHIVSLLLSVGCEINKLSHDRRTALFIASWHGYCSTVSLLLEAGADMYLADSYGNTPMSIAFQKGHPRIIEILTHHSNTQKKQCFLQHLLINKFL